MFNDFSDLASKTIEEEVAYLLQHTVEKQVSRTEQDVGPDAETSGRTSETSNENEEDELKR